MSTSTTAQIATRISRLAAERKQHKQSIAEHQKAVAKIDDDLRHLIGGLGVAVEVKP